MGHFKTGLIEKLVQCQKALLLSIATRDNFMSNLFSFSFFCSVQSANPLQFNSFVASTLTDLTPWKKKNLLSFSVISVVFTVSKSVVLHNYVNVAERDRGENASISRKTKNHRTSLRKTPLNKRQKNKLIFKTIPIWSTVLKKKKKCSWNHESAIL